MIERIAELLTQQNILDDVKDLTPITEGASDAYLFSIGEEYVVKYSNLTESDSHIREQIHKEYNFYRICVAENIGFIPKVISQIKTDDEILIILKKYNAIKHGEWDENLQKRAMELCACINAVSTEKFCELFQEDEISTEESDEPHPLSVSFENWERLQNKFPEHIDISLLRDMHKNYNEADLREQKLAIPQTLHHGDFHPENFLRDGDDLVICDWQGVGIGRGIGDVAFFISRGADMGLNINKDTLVQWYAEALLKYGARVDITELYKNIAASEFLVSFKFWANYLQDSDVERVLNIYNSMARSYNYLFSH